MPTKEQLLTKLMDWLQHVCIAGEGTDKLTPLCPIKVAVTHLPKRPQPRAGTPPHRRLLRNAYLLCCDLVAQTGRPKLAPLTRNRLQLLLRLAEPLKRFFDAHTHLSKHKPGHGSLLHHRSYF